MSDPTGAETQPTPADPTPTPDSPSEVLIVAAASGKHPIFEYAESIAKLATVILGALYVLGLLISNFQLMELGISDFASLQARNILAGFVFVIHVTLVLFTLALIVVLAGALRYGILR